MPEFLTVAKLGDIPDGEGRAFEYQDQMVAVFNDQGTYRAIDDMCPHMGASLAVGHYEDCIVTCPWHGWSFDTRDGAWCDNRRISIDVFQVRVVGDEIQVAAIEKKADETEADPTPQEDPAPRDSSTAQSDQVNEPANPDKSNPAEKNDE